MDPTAPQQPIQTEASSNGLSRLVTTLSVVAIILILGLGGFVYFSKNNPSIPKQTTQTANNTTSPTPDKNDLKGPFVYAQRTTIPTTVVCYRFTSLKEALVNIEAACILDLSGQNINSLPDEVIKLTKLNEINLSNNNFSEFPSQLLKIPTLISINLSKNKLTTTPNVNKLTSLQSLILTGNPITNKAVPTSAPIPSRASGSATKTPQPTPKLKITY